MDFEIIDQSDDWLTLVKGGIGVELKGYFYIMNDSKICIYNYF